MKLQHRIVKKANDLVDCWRTENSGQCSTCYRNWHDEGKFSDKHYKSIPEEDLNVLLEMFADIEHKVYSDPNKIKEIYGETWNLPSGEKTSDITRLPRTVVIIENNIPNAVIAGRVIFAGNVLGHSSGVLLRDKIIVGLSYKDRGGKEPRDLDKGVWWEE